MKPKTESRIVLALDDMSKERALLIAEKAAEMVWGFKVHDLIFHYGAEIVYGLKRFGNVVADARLFGSSKEMQKCISIFRSAGADIITIMGVVGSEITETNDLASLKSMNYGYVMDIEGW